MISSAHAVGSTALATERVERRLDAILAADGQHPTQSIEYQFVARDLRLMASSPPILSAGAPRHSIGLT